MKKKKRISSDSAVSIKSVEKIKDRTKKNLNVKVLKHTRYA